VPYASQTELEYAAGGADRLTQLTDWDDDGEPDQAAIDQALAQADAFLDQYLSLRYAVPIANPSPVLRGYAAEQAIYWLRQVRGMVGEEENRQLENRQHQLEMMRDGRLRPDEAAPFTAASTVVATFVERNPDVEGVSKRNLKGMW
jgi:phage gp36-like protein